MNKIEQLIIRLCPNGVVKQKIKNICNISIGEFVHKNKQRDDAPYPVYNGGISNTGFYDEYNNDGEMILISARGANAGFVNKISGKYWAGNSCYTLDVKDRVNNNWIFIYYLIKNNEQKLLGEQQRGSIPAISKKQIEDFEIGVPPLEVQDEIVHILDNFTLLSAELSAELKARQKQYEFYRDELLAFKNEKYEYKTLGEVATEMYRGNGIKRTEVTKTGIPCVRYGEIYTSYNVTFNECISHTNENIISSKKYFEHGDVLFAITGESVEEIGKSIVYLGKGRCLAGGDMVVMKHNQNPKYMAYVLSTTQAQMQKSRGKVKSKVVHSSVPDLKEISIPIPPLCVQEKIADMLEKLDKLCNDITDGLPAEIEARQKQYEYYRDKLLTFKEKKDEQVT